MFISKGEYVFLIRREQNLRPTGFRPAVADATCCSFGGHASPEDARMGRRIDEFRLVLVSVPVAAATFTHIGADTPRSFSRREGTIDSLLPVWSRLADVTLSGNHASTGMLAERDYESFCREYPAGV
jgi:hypothetical protein